MQKQALNAYALLKARVKRSEFGGLENPGAKRKKYDELVQQIECAVRARPNDHDTAALKARVLLCEVHDYFGRFHEAAALAAPGADLLDTLPRITGKVPEHEHPIALAKVRLATAYARA